MWQENRSSGLPHHIWSLYVKRYERTEGGGSENRKLRFLMARFLGLVWSTLKILLLPRWVPVVLNLVTVIKGGERVFFCSVLPIMMNKDEYKEGGREIFASGPKPEQRGG